MAAHRAEVTGMPPAKRMRTEEWSANNNNHHNNNNHNNNHHNHQHNTNNNNHHNNNHQNNHGKNNSNSRQVSRGSRPGEGLEQLLQDWQHMDTQPRGPRLD